MSRFFIAAGIIALGLSLIALLIWVVLGMRKKPKYNIKLVCFACIVASIILESIGFMTYCRHEWQDAICTSPRTCSLCGETEGEPLGHEWDEASCTVPKTCSLCGETDGEPLGHNWVDATCTEPETCARCGETHGTTRGHNWKAATCIQLKTCSDCGQTEGDFGEHTWIPATYDAPKTCSVCGATEGKPLIRYNDTVQAVYNNYESALSEATSHHSDADYSFIGVRERLLNLVAAADRNDLSEAQGYAWGLFNDDWDTMSIYQLKNKANEMLKFIEDEDNDRLSALMRKFRTMSSVSGTITEREVDIEVCDIESFRKEIGMNERTIGQILTVFKIYCANLEFTENGFTLHWNAIGEDGYELTLN